MALTPQLEADIADYLDVWYKNVLSKYGHRRFFRAKVASVVNNSGRFQVTVVKNGEIQSDGYLAMVVEPFYAPANGDDVMCCWIDKTSYVVMFPMGSAPCSLIGVFAGAPTGGPYTTGDISFDVINGTMWICIADGSPGTWRCVSSLSRYILMASAPVNMTGPTPTNGSAIPGMSLTFSIPTQANVNAQADCYVTGVPTGVGTACSILWNGSPTGFGSGLAINASGATDYGPLRAVALVTGSGSQSITLAVGNTPGSTGGVAASASPYSGQGPGGALTLTVEPY